mmetsp:Transcript_12594/g.30073  ORF Transcript_12594/g.30073 Transcript_12594/m.30073 type:complete len:136 (+) Transcript_12594:169-576(+)|eukprot:CAMPEP_0113627488 /NCGR_PEP_ID=MMETSP0017_2-20120614/14237_1 /TAXON_ID=2856 /ORGANISM="Cylindrotheca closterium" /LENGTH=135 /DNA_ID=CAMNT_0000537747 /DNA_START=109 /DNA_END=516 /DNA_ORIENTATION=+ /assembly_acc=CAM_ASM_000147
MTNTSSKKVALNDGQRNIVNDLKNTAKSIKNKAFRSSRAPTTTNNTNNPIRKTPPTCDTSSQGSAIDEAIDIINSPEERTKVRRASLVRRGSSVTPRAASELLLDNSDRLSVLMVSCSLDDLDDLSASDESDFDE